MITATELKLTEERDQRAKTEGFDRWLGQPTTRMVLADIHPSGKLKGLLQATFEQGYVAGQGMLAFEMLQGIIQREKP